jgi:hypothetical protein
MGMQLAGCKKHYTLFSPQDWMHTAGSKALCLFDNYSFVIPAFSAVYIFLPE